MSRNSGAWERILRWKAIAPLLQDPHVLLARRSWLPIFGRAQGWSWPDWPPKVLLKSYGSTISIVATSGLRRNSVGLGPRSSARRKGRPRHRGDEPMLTIALSKGKLLDPTLEV